MFDYSNDVIHCHGRDRGFTAAGYIFKKLNFQIKVQGNTSGTWYNAHLFCKKMP